MDNFQRLLTEALARDKRGLKQLAEEYGYDEVRFAKYPFCGVDYGMVRTIQSARSA